MKKPRIWKDGCYWIADLDGSTAVFYNWPRALRWVAATLAADTFEFYDRRGVTIPERILTNRYYDVALLGDPS